MKSKGETVNMQSVIDGLMRQLEGKDHMIQHLLNRVWKSPVCVTPEAQVPLTLESKFRMTPIKS